MRARPAVVVAAAVGMLLGAVACTAPPPATVEDLPSRAPDVSGAVAQDATLVDASDGYYEGMALASSEQLVIRDGREAQVADLRVGDTVDVWIGDSCEESFPVRCVVVAIEATSAR